MSESVSSPGEALRARGLQQQRRLLAAGAVLVGVYYLAFFLAGLYPLPAFLAGLTIPALLGTAAWRLPSTGPAESRAWAPAVTVGLSVLVLTASLLSAGTACVGFHVVWALPLVEAILVPWSLPALLAGAAVSTTGGLAIMVRDGHPATALLQWSALAAGALAFAVHRVRLNQRERDEALDAERRKDARVAFSEERYKLLADHTLDVIWTLDLATRRFTYVSPSVLKQRGFTVEQCLAQSLDQALAPESLTRALAVLANVGTPAEEDPHTGLYEQPCADGRLRHMEITATLGRDAQGRPVEVLGLSRDVSARVEAERALRRSEERSRALIENSSDLILVFDKDKRITFWSPSATDILGWTSADVVGKAFWELGLVHPDDVPTLAGATRDVATRPGRTMRTRLRHRHKDGSWRLIEGLGRNLLDDPAVGGVVVNARDVTEQERLQEHLQQAQKLDSIGRLAGGMAHDFNNLLTVIMSCSAGLRRDAAAGLTADPEDLEALRTAGERARDLTAQLLTFARRQPLTPVPVDLNEVVRAAAALLPRLLGEVVEVRTVLAEGLWTVRCDRGQLDQVLINLALNARDAMPGGGQLTLETRNLPGLPGVPGGGDQVELTVRDAGTGIAPEVRAHLFEPFFTTKPAGQGTGLGLATSYGIVKQHGGQIEVESEPGRGSAFRIRLPREPELAEPAVITPAPSPAGGSERLLVVEDDPLVRGMTVRVLRRAGYAVEVAASGVQALELVGSAPAAPRLVVTDVVMPGMDGRQVAEALRVRHPGLPVLYVSGYARETLGARDLAAPRTGFLAKPFSPEALLSQVRAMLDALPPA